jgi:DNA-binding XRE family transcriptional regulator
MPFSVPGPDPRIAPSLRALGEAVRQARRDRGLSQAALAELGGVSQSSISRLERGIAPQAPMHRIVTLGLVLGRALPLGSCPHDHECRWSPAQARSAGSEASAGWWDLGAVGGDELPAAVGGDELPAAVGGDELPAAVGDSTTAQPSMHPHDSTMQ